MLPYPEIDPVAVALGPVKIHWYALTYLGGFAFAWWLARRRTQMAHSPLRRDQIDDLIFYAAIGVILGGRFGYALFYGSDQLAADPLWLLKVWQGGMAFHGGFLGVLVAMALFARQQNIVWGHLMDFVALLTPVGLALGRLGNFINQELWGRVTDAPWAVVFPAGGPLPRHPSQLYEAALEGVVLFLLVWFYSARPRAAGRVSGLFLLGYALMRLLVEFFREPDAHLGFIFLESVTMGQILSVPVGLFGLWLLLRPDPKTSAARS